MTLKPLVAGNWKMNGAKNALAEVETLIAGLSKPQTDRVDVMICPPATLLSDFARVAEDSALMCGGQDCHRQETGAYTGDISAEMIADCGGSAVIVGHSERRADHGESDELVAGKVNAVWRAGLMAIVCVGETEAQKDAGETLQVVCDSAMKSLPDGANAQNCVVAYEPVWAIGTGRTPTVEDVARVHWGIRKALKARFGEDGAVMRILYGGSVKPGNASELMAVEHVNGALVGGASLKSVDFLGILNAYSK